METTRPLMTGLFPDRESAERGYSALSERGYSKDDVNLAMSDETRKHFVAGGTETELGHKAAEGAGVGGAIGGTIGAIAAAVAAIGTSLVLPGLGLVIAGPLAAAVAGAGAGAATGGLVGALIGWNIPEERVKQYEEGIKNGGILMGVHPRSDDDAEYLHRHWTSNEARDVYRPGSPNRDPISGELGAHPVGTGVGAAAGGVAAGAAVGSVAGPVGTAVGAAVGAIAGGLAGKGVAEAVEPTTSTARTHPDKSV